MARSPRPRPVDPSAPYVPRLTHVGRIRWAAAQASLHPGLGVALAYAPPDRDHAEFHVYLPAAWERAFLHCYRLRRGIREPAIQSAVALRHLSLLVAAGMTPAGVGYLIDRETLPTVYAMERLALATGARTAPLRRLERHG